jgi:SpoVK/Ycf46/Vps4 family AAA+-type ATPase
VYLVGNKGAGKSAVASAVARSFRCSSQSLCFSEVVHCKLLKGSKRSVVQTTLENVVRRAIANAPSVIVLDDLDALVPAAGSSGGGDGAEDVQVRGWCLHTRVGFLIYFVVFGTKCCVYSPTSAILQPALIVEQQSS